MEDENSILPPPKRTPWNKGKLPDQSTTLRVDSSSTDDLRLRGAPPTTNSCSAANSASFYHPIGDGK